MGVLDDFKRLFWAKKAVAKSAADKAVDKSLELGDDLKEAAEEAWQKSKKLVADAADKISDDSPKKTPDPVKKDDWVPRDSTEETSAFKTGEKLGEKAAKIGDAAEKTWDKAKEEGKEILDKAVKMSDKTWEKAEEVSGDIWDKAKKVAGDVNKKFNEGVDDMLEKAKDLDKKIEEERDKIDANRDGWADKTVHDKLKEHDSTLKGKDDFFEKASRYADGDYSMGKPVVTGKDTPEDDSNDHLTPLPPLPKKTDIADDAILDDGNDKE